MRMRTEAQSASARERGLALARLFYVCKIDYVTGTELPFKKVYIIAMPLAKQYSYSCSKTH